MIRVECVILGYNQVSARLLSKQAYIDLRTGKVDLSATTTTTQDNDDVDMKENTTLTKRGRRDREYLDQRKKKKSKKNQPKYCLDLMNRGECKYATCRYSHDLPKSEASNDDNATNDTTVETETPAQTQ